MALGTKKKVTPRGVTYGRHDGSFRFGACFLIYSAYHDVRPSTYIRMGCAKNQENGAKSEGTSTKSVFSVQSYISTTQTSFRDHGNTMSTTPPIRACCHLTAPPGSHAIYMSPSAGNVMVPTYHQNHVRFSVPPIYGAGLQNPHPPLNSSNLSLEPRG